MNTSIRLALPADTDGVVQVIRAVYEEYGFTWDPEHYHADLYDLQGHYLEPGHVFWVAETEEEGIVGTVALTFFAVVPGDPGHTTLLEETVRLCGCDCALKRFYVHPAARRRGIGSALMGAVLQEARRRGRRCLEIWSDKRFVDAHRLYRRLGASLVGERICHDPDQSPEWGLILQLQAA